MFRGFRTDGRSFKPGGALQAGMEGELIGHAAKEDRIRRNLDLSSANQLHVIRLIGDCTMAMAVIGVVALMGLVGLGAGALLKNQIVAVSVGLVVVLILENLLLLIPGVRHAYPYLPGGAINAMTARQTGSDRSVGGVHLLPIWGGTVALAVWAVAMAVLGAGVTMNRDIT